MWREDMDRDVEKEMQSMLLIVMMRRLEQQRHWRRACQGERGVASLCSGWSLLHSFVALHFRDQILPAPSSRNLCEGQPTTRKMNQKLFEHLQREFGSSPS